MSTNNPDDPPLTDQPILPVDTNTQESYQLINQRMVGGTSQLSNIVVQHPPSSFQVSMVISNQENTESSREQQPTYLISFTAPMYGYQADIPLIPLPKDAKNSRAIISSVTRRRSASAPHPSRVPKVARVCLPPVNHYCECLPPQDPCQPKLLRTLSLFDISRMDLEEVANEDSEENVEESGEQNMPIENKMKKMDVSKGCIKKWKPRKVNKSRYRFLTLKEYVAKLANEKLVNVLTSTIVRGTKKYVKGKKKPSKKKTKDAKIQGFVSEMVLLHERMAQDIQVYYMHQEEDRLPSIGTIFDMPIQQPIWPPNDVVEDSLSNGIYPEAVRWDGGMDTANTLMYEHMTFPLDDVSSLAIDCRDLNPEVYPSSYQYSLLPPGGAQPSVISQPSANNQPSTNDQRLPTVPSSIETTIQPMEESRAHPPAPTLSSSSIPSPSTYETRSGRSGRPMQPTGEVTQIAPPATNIASRSRLSQPRENGYRRRVDNYLYTPRQAPVTRRRSTNYRLIMDQTPNNVSSNIVPVEPQQNGNGLRLILPARASENPRPRSSLPRLVAQQPVEQNGTVSTMPTLSPQATPARPAVRPSRTPVAEPLTQPTAVPSVIPMADPPVVPTVVPPVSPTVVAPVNEPTLPAKPPQTDLESVHNKIDDSISSVVKNVSKITANQIYYDIHRTDFKEIVIKTAAAREAGQAQWLCLIHQKQYEGYRRRIDPRAPKFSTATLEHQQSLCAACEHPRPTLPVLKEICFPNKPYLRKAPKNKVPPKKVVPSTNDQLDNTAKPQNRPELEEVASLTAPIVANPVELKTCSNPPIVQQPKTTPDVSESIQVSSEPSTSTFSDESRIQKNPVSNMSPKSWSIPSTSSLPYRPASNDPIYDAYLENDNAFIGSSRDVVLSSIKKDDEDEYIPAVDLSVDAGRITETSLMTEEADNDSFMLNYSNCYEFNNSLRPDITPFDTPNNTSDDLNVSLRNETVQDVYGNASSSSNHQGCSSSWSVSTNPSLHGGSTHGMNTPESVASTSSPKQTPVEVEPPVVVTSVIVTNINTRASESEVSNQNTEKTTEPEKPVDPNKPSPEKKKKKATKAKDSKNTRNDKNQKEIRKSKALIRKRQLQVLTPAQMAIIDRGEPFHKPDALLAGYKRAYWTLLTEIEAERMKKLNEEKCRNERSSEEQLIETEAKSSGEGTSRAKEVPVEQITASVKDMNASSTPKKLLSFSVEQLLAKPVKNCNETRQFAPIVDNEEVVVLDLHQPPPTIQAALDSIFHLANDPKEAPAIEAAMEELANHVKSMNLKESSTVAFTQVVEPVEPVPMVATVATEKLTSIETEPMVKVASIETVTTEQLAPIETEATEKLTPIIEEPQPTEEIKPSSDEIVAKLTNDDTVPEVEEQPSTETAVATMDSSNETEKVTDNEEVTVSAEIEPVENTDPISETSKSKTSKKKASRKRAFPTSNNTDAERKSHKAKKNMSMKALEISLNMVTRIQTDADNTRHTRSKKDRALYSNIWVENDCRNSTIGRSILEEEMKKIDQVLNGETQEPETSVSEVIKKPKKKAVRKIKREPIVGEEKLTRRVEAAKRKAEELAIEETVAPKKEVAPIKTKWKGYFWVPFESTPEREQSLKLMDDEPSTNDEEKVVQQPRRSRASEPKAKRARTAVQSYVDIDYDNLTFDYEGVELESENDEEEEAAPKRKIAKSKTAESSKTSDKKVVEVKKVLEQKKKPKKPSTKLTKKKVAKKSKKSSKKDDDTEFIVSSDDDEESSSSDESSSEESDNDN